MTIHIDYISRKHGSGNARKRKVNPHITTWDQPRVSALPVVVVDVYAYDIPVVPIPCPVEIETPKRFTIRKTEAGRFEIVDGKGNYVYESHKRFEQAKVACLLLNRNAVRIPSRT